MGPHHSRQDCWAGAVLDARAQEGASLMQKGCGADGAWPAAARSPASSTAAASCSPTGVRSVSLALEVPTKPAPPARPRGTRCNPLPAKGAVELRLAVSPPTARPLCSRTSTGPRSGPFGRPPHAGRGAMPGSARRPATRPAPRTCCHRNVSPGPAWAGPLGRPAICHNGGGGFGGSGGRTGAFRGRRRQSVVGPRTAAAPYM